MIEIIKEMNLTVDMIISLNDWLQKFDQIVKRNENEVLII